MIVKDNRNPLGMLNTYWFGWMLKKMRVAGSLDV
jgi:hypothetical protein